MLIKYKKMSVAYPCQICKASFQRKDVNKHQMYCDLCPITYICKPCKKTNVKEYEIRNCVSCKTEGCVKCISCFCEECKQYMCKKCYCGDAICGCFGTCWSCYGDVDIRRDGWPCQACGKWTCRKCECKCNKK